MNELKEIVEIVLKKQKVKLASSTYENRKPYLVHLVNLGTKMGIGQPCQRLYDAYVSKATTKDIRFQLFHAVRLVDKEAKTKAFYARRTTL